MSECCLHGSNDKNDVILLFYLFIYFLDWGASVQQHQVKTYYVHRSKPVRRKFAEDEHLVLIHFWSICYGATAPTMSARFQENTALKS